MSLTRFIKIASLLLISLALLSCATGSQSAVSIGPNIEVMLLEAGFVRNPIDSPEKMERARAEVQRKVIPYQDLEQIYYIYADVDLCLCLYVGNESAFSRFEELIYLKNIKRNTCIDERMRSVQAEPWREFGELGSLCSDRP
ncbi:hypothetical protein KAJ77_06785 [bacterium]|nr:hypothetical protein [bacterium]